eukprot:TRINITY_DN3974_c0_g1_i1.p2 TRINITY_DN3974_c0_g1~~TRINITY_DN3974_c0_g1_i1.p2  ORF type:complete len:100 (+),score=18.13 TRINITY_DN3974_c0_g1_i1:268-567(+)
MERHTENALKVAEYLKQHPKSKMGETMTGLSDHPQHKLAQKYVEKVNLLANPFLWRARWLRGGARFIDALQLLRVWSNIGDDLKVFRPSRLDVRAKATP